MTPLLALAGVTKRFHAGTPSEAVALRDINLTLAAVSYTHLTLPTICSV